MIDERALDEAVLLIGAQLADALPSAARHPGQALDDRAMVLVSRDRALQAALFRLVDVVPACRGPDDLARHLTGFLGELDEAPAPVEAARRLGDSRAGRLALGAAAAAGVQHMAHRFIVGETPSDALAALGGMWRQGIASSVDLLGESTVTAAEADAYARRCADALDVLTAASRRWAPRPVLEADGAGTVARVNLSVKVSALTPLLRPEAPERGRADAGERLRPLLRRARAHGAHLHVDMESLDSREVVLGLVLDLLSEPEFRAGPSAGIVVQAYLRDSPETLDAVLGWAGEAGRHRAAPLTIRLVKGAYWDHEVIEARRHGWETPVFEDKAACDANFELLSRRLLDARPTVRVAIASHNLRSVAHAIAWSRLSGGSDRDLELQVLRGLGDPLAAALAGQGLRVRAYCPVGDLVAGMAYLVRRLLENTANESFLHEQARGEPLERLLARPVPDGVGGGQRR